METLQYKNQLFIYHKQLYNLGCHHLFTTKPLGFGFFRESEEDLIKNMALIREVMNTQAPVFYMHQQHTNKIIDINKSELIPTKHGYLKENVDGLYTNKTNQLLLSTYADCTPFLIFDPINKVQVNCHSGWRGYLSEILLNALNMFETNDIHVLSGPHLLFEDFEVDYDVAKLFIKKFSQIKNLVIQQGSKYHIDLNKITHYFCDFKKIPFENRHFINLSTLQDHRLHSFRKDKQEFKQMALISTLVD